MLQMGKGYHRHSIDYLRTLRCCLRRKLHHRRCKVRWALVAPGSVKDLVGPGLGLALVAPELWLVVSNWGLCNHSLWRLGSSGTEVELMGKSSRPGSSHYQHSPHPIRLHCTAQDHRPCSMTALQRPG